MIIIESYLRVDGEFVPVAEATSPPPDSYYIEGALELSVDGVAIVTKEMWDYIDQLWAYLSSMVFRLTSERELRQVHTYFPDQPIKLDFRRLGGGNLLVSADLEKSRTASLVSESLLIEALRRAGKRFFTKMSSLTPENSGSYAEALDQLGA